MADIIAKLIAQRYFIGVTQRELSEKIGVDSGLVSKWEIGNRKPSIFMTFCWANALNLDIEVVPSGQKIERQRSKGRTGNCQYINWRRIKGKTHRSPSDLFEK